MKIWHLPTATLVAEEPCVTNDESSGEAIDGMPVLAVSLDGQSLACTVGGKVALWSFSMDG